MRKKNMYNNEKECGGLVLLTAQMYFVLIWKLKITNQIHGQFLQVPVSQLLGIGRIQTQAKA